MILAVKVSGPIKETIILEGYSEGICIADLKKFRQFVFECISSLINVLFPFEFCVSRFTCFPRGEVYFDSYFFVIDCLRIRFWCYCFSVIFYFKSSLYSS